MPPARLALPCLLATALAAGAAAQGFHQREPVHYGRTADDTAVTALNRRLAAGEVTLPSAGRSGRLRALLRALAVPESSQTLVFAKTSLQRHRIGWHSPRALYFGPDVYIGWVPDAAAIEVAAGDPRLGLVFYTLAQDPEEPPQLRRDDSCLSCHASYRTDDEPGLLLRSVFADARSEPIHGAGETLVTYRTPMAERWGGWLVTGAFAGQHRGNGFAHRDDQGQWRVLPRAAADLGAFAAAFDPADYPAATSDIGALLALEQQATIHNLLVRAALQVRVLLHDDAATNRALGETGLRASTAKVLDRLAREIAAALLLAGEASLDGHQAAAAPRFAADFAAPWPVDRDGRRLGELDLRERTFVLPLSPMVHSRAFAALPDELRARVLARLRLVLLKGRLPGGVDLGREVRLQLHAHLEGTLAGY